MAQYTVKYRTFDQLLEDVTVDFSSYALEGMIEPQQLIKVATRVNYDLGLRIHSQKEIVLDIEHGSAKLPSDFYVVNFILLAGKMTYQEPVLGGTHIEELVLDPGNVQLDSNDCPTDSSICKSPCGTYYQLIQKFKTSTVTYESLDAVHITPSSSVSADCPNTRWSSPYQADIRNGFIYTSFDTGKLYLNYQGAMEDEYGNLLVMDHPLVNEYYEYAVKQRVLENMYINGEDVVQKLNLIEQRLRGARNNALSLVNTPDYAEMKKLWETNRKAQYHKYYDMFRSYPVARS
jgi:hypothetical protein